MANLTTGQKWGIGALIVLVIGGLIYAFRKPLAALFSSAGSNAGNTPNYASMTDAELIALLTTKAGLSASQLEGATHDQLVSMAQVTFEVSTDGSAGSTSRFAAAAAVPASSRPDNALINAAIDEVFNINNADQARTSRAALWDMVNANLQKRGLNYIVYEKGQRKNAPKDTVVCCCWDESRKILGIEFTITKCNYANNVVNCPTCVGSSGKA